MIVDCGRLAPDSPALGVVRRADLTLLLTRPDVEAVFHTQVRLQAMRADDVLASSVSVVVVGDRPYPPGAVDEAVDAPVLGHVELDAKAAAVLSGLPGRPRSIDRSLLVRSVRTVYGQLEGRLGRAGGALPAAAEPIPAPHTQEVSS